ncbi:MAG: hypothetical protein H6Q13_2294 [Bacteroidetes bacterium]|nr:hypothetical protein [Bacteroidota bacterium]
MKRIIITLFLLQETFFLFSQEFRHYDTMDGLSSIEVTSICENENFMWMATTDGLNRFDGRNFKVYKRENGNPNSLTANNIETLLFDSGGLLWIGLKTGGVDIYDPQKDQFTHLRNIIKGKCPHRVISIFEDSQKNIWLGSWEEGLYRLTPNKSHGYDASAYYDGYIISSILEKPRGYVWFGSYFGFFVYDLNSKQWIEKGKGNMAVTQFLDSGEKDALWCSTWNSGLLKMQWNGTKPMQVKTEAKHTGKEFLSIFRMLQGAGNNLYLGTWGGGVKMINADDSNIRLLANKNFDASLINCLYRDKYNDIWIGTFGKGIYRFNPDENGIKRFPVSHELPVSAMSLTSVENNSILVGTQGNGVYLCRLSDNSIVAKSGNIKNGSLNNYILSMYSDHQFIMAGHDGYGFLYHFKEGNTHKELNLKSFSGDKQLEKITSFFYSDDGRMWIGSKQNGLMSVNPDKKRESFTRYIHYDSFGRDEITGFAPYDKHHLWISSHSGLYLFNTQSNKIEKNGHIISDEIVYSLAMNKQNHCLWIGTSTDLLQIDKGSTQAHTVFPSDILPKGAIKDLTLDSENNLWFSIGGRIFCYMTSRKMIKEINATIFGKHTILSASRAIIDNREHIVFGSTDYLIIIDPHLALNQSEKTKILLIELQVDHQRVKAGEKIHDKIVLTKEAEYVSSIELSYKSKWVSLSFTETGTDFYNNKYQYRIRGFSDNWQYLNLSYPISFSQLVPGSYVLEIRKYDGFADKPVCWSMDITVTPPWWNTGWFYTLVIICIAITLGLIIYLILRRYKKQQLRRLHKIERVKQEELLREKESFFAGLSHDLLTPFSLIVAPANDLLRESAQEDPQREKLEIIAKNASFLSDIFSTILDFKRAEFSDSEIKERKTEIVSFTRLVVQSFAYLAKSKNIGLDYQSSMPELYLLIDHVKIERILYNLISNSLKYTSEEGMITVSLDYDDSRSELCYQIKDNGAGIEKINQLKVFDKFYREPKYAHSHTSQGFGIGLYVVKRFVAMLNGKLSIESEPGKGTKVNITLPAAVCPNEMDKELDAAKNSSKQDDAITILLVEDNEELREYLKTKFSSHFTVITARNGVEAMELIAEYLPEIVVSDVMMPESDGFTLCRRIKENSLYADIFVILLTAKSSTDDELQGYKAGADIYIKKPFDSDALINQMININQTRQKRKAQLLGRLVSPDSKDIEFDPKDQFLQQSMKVIEEHLMDADFKIDEFAAEMNISKTVLHRKFRALVGQTPNQFIRTIRLRKAVNLLNTSELTIAEIAYLTGFNQSHYFIKCFREVYNDTPKNFRQALKKDSF